MPVSTLDALLPLLLCREEALSLACCLERSRCCFFFNPWSRLMMMSRILGKNLSRLAGLAS